MIVTLKQADTPGDNVLEMEMIEYEPAQGSYVLNFDGKSGYVQVANDASFTLEDKITVEAWVKLRAWYNNQYFPVIDKAWRMDANRDGIDFPVGYARAAKTDYVLPDNKWVHVAFTYNLHTEKARYYINGNLQTEKDYDEKFLNINQNIFIGRGPTGADEYANGYIDEIRVWNIIRTRNEIASNLNRKLTGREEGLVAYWNFDEGEGNTVDDMSINKNHGELFGGVSWVLAHDTID